MDFKLVHPINLKYPLSPIDGGQRDKETGTNCHSGRRHERKGTGKGADTTQRWEGKDVESKTRLPGFKDGTRRPLREHGGFFYFILGVKNVCYSFPEKWLCKDHKGSNMISHPFLLYRSALFLSFVETLGVRTRPLCSADAHDSSIRSTHSTTT